MNYVIAGQLRAALAPSLTPPAWASEEPIQLNDPVYIKPVDRAQKNAEAIEAAIKQAHDRNTEMIMEAHVALDKFAKETWIIGRRRVREEKQAQAAARKSMMAAARKLTAEKFAALKRHMQEFCAAKRNAWVAAADKLRARITGPVGFCRKRVTRLLPGYALSGVLVRDWNCLAGQLLGDLRRAFLAVEYAA